MADTLRERFSRLAELMDGSRDKVLAYMAFPREHWAQIASTNLLERLDGEIKRRPDVIGIFPNEPAVVRLVGGSCSNRTTRGRLAPLNEPGTARHLER